MAKDFLVHTREEPRYHIVSSTSWELRLGTIPLQHDIDQTLYELVHTPTVKEYWINKSRITKDTFSSVLWPKLGMALAKMPLSRRLFCSKHTSGMCGVGKFQNIWKTRETDACPHCGQFKDSLHVWKCTSSTVYDVWTNSLNNLKTALRKLDTCPDLKKNIIAYLNA
jgi:hypothetical protein